MRKNQLIAVAIGILVAVSILSVNALRSDDSNEAQGGSDNSTETADDNGVVSRSASAKKSNRTLGRSGNGARRTPGADGVLGTNDDVVVNEDNDGESSDEPDTDEPDTDEPGTGGGTKPRPPIGDRPEEADQVDEGPVVRDHRDPSNDPNPPGGTTVEEDPGDGPVVRDHRDEPEVRDHRDEGKPSWCQYFGC